MRTPTLTEAGAAKAQASIILGHLGHLHEMIANLPSYDLPNVQPTIARVRVERTIKAVEAYHLALPTEPPPEPELVAHYLTKDFKASLCGEAPPREIGASIEAYLAGGTGLSVCPKCSELVNS